MEAKQNYSGAAGRAKRIYSVKHYIYMWNSLLIKYLCVDFVYIKVKLNQFEIKQSGYFSQLSVFQHSLLRAVCL